ncbi:DUF4332 domain-containing protein [Prochlorococcus sp. MIT 1223]|uniref:DUF4332 domain-containing protein n=1 Tax=Prochlorococcus sp. MIT 1223 TaxID=3096217 RepID=UPI002A75FBE4|nr:DUF4332 domain-containing protein [Prochlorococcus sp. MIT 1223]
MKTQDPFKNIPKNFQEEKKILLSLGINSWAQIKRLKDEELTKITQTTMATSRNLKRLRCIANLICDLKVSLGEAALLMHSGVSTIQALSVLSPAELVQKTGRFERFLKTGRQPIINLQKAHSLITKAIKHNHQIGLDQKQH